MPRRRGGLFQGRCGAKPYETPASQPREAQLSGNSGDLNLIPSHRPLQHWCPLTPSTPENVAHLVGGTPKRSARQSPPAGGIDPPWTADAAGDQQQPGLIHCSTVGLGGLNICCEAMLPPLGPAMGRCQSLFVTIYNRMGNAPRIDNSIYVSFGSQGNLQDRGAETTYPTNHPMRTHPIEAAAIAAVAAVRLVRAVAVPVVALALTVAGWRPAVPAAVASVAAPAAVAPLVPHAAVAPLVPHAAGMTVVQLRQMARAAGHRALARSGRRAELLAALALA